MLKLRMAVLGVAALTFACGETSGSLLDSGLNTTDAGVGGSDPSDAGVTVPPDAGMDRELYFSSELTLVEHPLANEAPVMGDVLVMDHDFQRIGGATVTVNGVAVPEVAGKPGRFDVSAVGITAAPGEPIEIHVVGGSTDISAEIPCPAAVAIGGVAEGQAVSEGETLTLTWQGVLPDSSFYPELALRGYDPVTNTAASAATTYLIKDEDTSAQLEVPQTALRGYVLDLEVHGETVYPSRYNSSCTIVNRVHLTRP